MSSGTSSDTNVEDFCLNYKIPKKESSGDNVAYKTPLDWGQSSPGAPSGLQGPWFPSYQRSPVISVPATCNVASKRPITKEVPKNIHPEKTYRNTCPDVKDESLPKELTAQFQPLYCKLCNAYLNSTVNAALHYKGKNHERRVRKFLIDYSQKTGEPLHKRAKIQEIETTQDDPKYTYCEVCDLKLTSKMHAEQHYMGRNHQKALLHKKPAGSGYYDSEGKWHRTQKPEKDITGRNGIGLAFAKPEEFQQPTNKFHCSICNVSTTSNEHLESHYAGQKHLKMLKKQVVETPTNTIVTQPVPVIENVACNYRTPSGQYYCQPCNLSLNSEAQFNQHLESKKHVKNRTAFHKKSDGQ